MFRILCVVILLLCLNLKARAECQKQYDTKEHIKESQLIINISISNLPSATDLTCVVLKTLNSKSKNIPKDFIITLSDKNKNSGAILRVSTEENLLVLIEFNKNKENSYTITAITYPEPLKRIKEMLSKKHFPTSSTLTTYELFKYKALKSLVTEGELLKILENI
jgi:hypothetical protein